MFQPEDAAVVVPALIFSIPIIAIWTGHRQKMAEIKARSGGATNHAVNMGNAGVELTQAVQELRREVASLRETSTRFDMSFDAAITRLEERMERVETRQDHQEGSLPGGYASAPIPDGATFVQSAGRGR